jgi:hypothetical protein
MSQRDRYCNYALFHTSVVSAIGWPFALYGYVIQTIQLAKLLYHRHT